MGESPRSHRSSGGDSVTNDDLDEALAIHSQEEREYIESVLKRAFPHGVDEHAAYHDKAFKAAEAQEEFWRAAKMRLLDKGISGVLTAIAIVLGLAVLGLATKLGFPLPYPPHTPGS